MKIEELEKLLSDATDAEYGSHRYARKLDRQLCTALRNAAPALIEIARAAQGTLGTMSLTTLNHQQDILKVALQKLEETKL